MKPSNKLLLTRLAAIVLPLTAHAAPVSWGSWSAVTDNTAIQTPGGYTTIEGVNFNGSTTTINNGSTDVTFTGIAQNASGSAAGITVATSGFAFQSTGSGNSNVSSAVGTPQPWGTVLDRVIGDEGTVNATIDLTGLASGSTYFVQFFSNTPDGNINGTTRLASGDAQSDPFGSPHAGGATKYVIATFTADSGSQSFAISGVEPTFSALVIGVQPAGGDTTPPEWTATWPQADPLSSTSLSVRARTNEAGNAYYVVLADGAPAPSSAQVKAGNDSANAPATAAGSLALTANTEATAAVGGLTPGTAYDVYFVAEDAVPNLQASPAKVDATTPAPDTTAPDWIATWPQAEQLSPTSITVRAQTNETGTAYFVVLAGGATAPSAAQVKAGNDSANAPATAAGNLALTANTEATGPVTGLTANTSYDVYFIAEDAVPNLQSTPALVSVSLVTPAVVTWDGSWTDVTNATAILTPGGYTYGGVNLNGSTTTIGSVAFTGIAQNASGSAAGITVGTSGFAFQSTGSGNSNVVSTEGAPQTWATVLDRVIGDDNNSATIDLTGLTPGTDYTVQFFSSTPDPNINQTTKITSGGVESPAFGTHSGGQTRYIVASFTANSTNQSFSISGAEPTFGALVIGVESSNTYANWIGGFSGLNGLTDFDDDADFDGLDNGLENFLGTAPNSGNAGLTAGTLSGHAFTFIHPQNATPASDVSAPVYTWSTDLVSWNASDASSGGISVNLLATTNTPSAGTTTVTATVTGTVPPKLFVRLAVTQN
jgi:hypothetical protein